MSKSQSNEPNSSQPKSSSSNPIDQPSVIPPGISGFNFRQIASNNFENDGMEQQSGSGRSSKRPRLISESESLESDDEDQIIDPSKNE